MDGTAADAWKSLVGRYQKSTDLTRVYAQRELRSARLGEGEDFVAHMSDLHTKHRRANTVGAKIEDADFHEIVLASLPASWDPIISTLHATTSSSDTLILLDMHWSRINRNAKPTTSGTLAIALKAVRRADTYSKKQCTNPICKHKGHLIADCYWKGGGKEGQFPSGFGQRGGTTGSAAGAAALSTPTPSTPIASAAVVETVYALSAMMLDDEELHVTATVDTPSSLQDPAECDLDDLPDLIEHSDKATFEFIMQDAGMPIMDFGEMYTPAKLLDIIQSAKFRQLMESSDMLEPETVRRNLFPLEDQLEFTEYTVTAIPTSESVEAIERGEIVVMVAGVGGEADRIVTITYANSGASNHCFANKTDFSTYELFVGVREGQAASKSARFRIHGKGTVIKHYISDEKATQMIFTNALHTPDFAANLVSISQFDLANFTVIFGGGLARFINPKGLEILTIKRKNGMYVFEEAEPEQDVTAMPAKSHEKPTSIDQWHRRFCHFGICTIKDMSSKQLVDGLDITQGSKEATGMCEDCVYGKQTNRPYDEMVSPETEMLEHVHMDLWGPARVTSTGGAKYALLMTDGAVSFRKSYFLSEKLAAATLQAVTKFVAEAEKQTGKKVKCFRMDMGKEFLNAALDAFCKEKEICIETPAPYAHSGNGVAERTNRTVFEGVRCVRCDSGLPPSYWADILANNGRCNHV